MAVKRDISDTQIDKEAKTFGEQLKEFPKVKVRLYLDAEEKRKLEALQEQGKEVQWPTEMIALNGYRYYIQRGKEVELPEPIAQIAKDAGLC